LELPNLESNWSVNEAHFESYAVLEQILHGLSVQPNSRGKWCPNASTQEGGYSRHLEVSFVVRNAQITLHLRHETGGTKPGRNRHLDTWLLSSVVVPPRWVC